MAATVQAVYYSTQPLHKSIHFHDCYQIILITRGTADFLVNGVRITAAAGDVAVFSRYEDHSVVACSGAYERYILQIGPEAASQNSTVYALLTDRPQGFCNVIHVAACQDAIFSIFRQLLAEQQENAALSEELQRLLVRQLLILIYRCANVAFDSLHDQVVIALKRQFERSYAEPYTLEVLAAQFHISPSSLSHRFREATGTSVMHYLQSIRIASAKRLLAETDYSISRIVEECGFSDTSNFTRTFHRLHGMTPSDFRKQYASL